VAGLSWTSRTCTSVTPYLVPDLAGWRRERMPDVAEDLVAFELAPDWICETLSPATGTLDRVRKMPTYAREGVQFAWLLEPIQRTLEEFHLQGGQWKSVGTWEGDVKVRAVPLPARCWRRTGSLATSSELSLRRRRNEASVENDLPGSELLTRPGEGFVDVVVDARVKPNRQSGSAPLRALLVRTRRRLARGSDRLPSP